MLTRVRIPIRLRWKFLIGVLDLVFLFGGIHLYLLKASLVENLGKELSFRTMTLASSLANASLPLLLHEERVDLHKLLLEAKHQEPRVRYVMVLDPAGVPVVHTFGNRGIPEGLPSANSLTPEREQHSVRIDDARRLGQTYLDLAYPIGEAGHYGTLRVGMDESAVRYSLNRTVLSFLLMVLIFVALGILGALMLSWWITQPMQRIQTAMENFDFSAPVPPIDIRTGDELEEFALGVEKMMRRLRGIHEQMELLRMRIFRADRIAVVGTLAAGLAHEIGNPLAGLKNCLQRLSRDPKDAQVQKYLPMMQSGADSIQETVSRFKEFSRSPVKKNEPFLVNDAVEAALSLIRFRLEDRAVQVRVELADDLGALVGDRLLLEQVLLNLFINALDAMREGGGILSITGFRENARLVLEVRDSGQGIPGEQLEQVFDPLFTTKGGKGTGLGLAISQEIVRRFHGHIQADSEPGRGTTFRIELPVDEE